MKAIDLLEALAASGKGGYITLCNAGIYDSPEDLCKELFGTNYKIVVRAWEQTKKVLVTRNELETWGDVANEANAVLVGVERERFDVRYLYCVDD